MTTATKKKSVAFATVVFSLFSLSVVFHDIRTVRSFSASCSGGPRTNIHRKYEYEYEYEYNPLSSRRRHFYSTRLPMVSTKLDKTEVDNGNAGVVRSNNNNNKRSQSRQRKSNNNSYSNTKNKKYKDRNEQQQRQRKRRELKNKLLRASDSILYYGKDDAKKKNNNGNNNLSSSVLDERPSIRLRTEFLPAVVRSYSAVLLQTDDPELVLFDPWEMRTLILQESRPVQERILGLLAVLLQVTTHIEEEHTLYNNNNNNDKKKSAEHASTTDYVRFVQSKLWRTCREVLNDMLATADSNDGNGNGNHKEPHVLSPIAITALATSLRAHSKFLPAETKPVVENSSNNGNNNVHGVEEIKELIRLVHDARIAAAAAAQTSCDDKDNENLDRALLHSWNCYLSSLCDRALATNNPGDAGLETAALLLLDNSNSDDNNVGVDSDITSYNAVMGNAGKLGNATLVDALWQDLLAKRGELPREKQLSLQPNSKTYNARLMVTSDWTERLQILDNEILPDVLHLWEGNAAAVGATPAADVSIFDGFTIDLLLIPLLQADRKNQLFELIDDWMMLVNSQHNKPSRKGLVLTEKQKKINNNKAQRAFQNAMSAFFITLVQRNGDIRTARELWNRYMLLEMGDNNKNGVGVDVDVGDDPAENCDDSPTTNTMNIVFPERRHYNILLDGYARLVDEVRDRQGPNLDLSDETPGFSRKTTTMTTMKTTKIWEAKGGGDAMSMSTPKFYHEVQEKAIRDGQNLFALMMAQHQQQNSRNKMGSDIYTKSTMIRLCRSGSEVHNLLRQASYATSAGATRSRSDQRTWLPRSVVRAAITTCGRLGDPSMACKIFEDFMFPESDGEKRNFFSNYRAFNTLLGALANGAKMENPKLNVIPAGANKDTANPSFLLAHVHGLTCTEAVVRILNLMISKNSQTYCVAASALQYAPLDEQTRYSPSTKSSNDDEDNDDAKKTPLGLQIFHNATNNGIQADGRLVNAIFRCYGDDIAGALDGWKTHIRSATDQYENRIRSPKKKNMLAAYNGLMYVCGRAERPDIAVRIVYAMINKEGLEISENPYNCYRSGKTTRQELFASRPDEKEATQSSRWRRMRLPKLAMVGQYENILYVECKKYDTRDRRMDEDKRVRIIV